MEGRDLEMENSSAPGAIAGVVVGLVLLLILGVAVIFAMVCLVRHRNAQSENRSTVWMSTGEGLSFGMAHAREYLSMEGYIKYH